MGLPPLLIPPKKNQPLARKCSFGMGGTVELFLTLSNTAELKTILAWLKAEGRPWFLLGRGTNLIIPDRALKGVILQLGGTFKEITPKKAHRLSVGAGAGDLALARKARSLAFSGVEFLGTIPGSIGGAVYMNAGAHGHELAEVLEWAEILTPEGELLQLKPQELQMGYRSSLLQSTRCICLRAQVRLSLSNPSKIAAQEKKWQQQRRISQPTQARTFGSLFKNPPEDHAGRIIEALGFKGKQFGHCRISPIHANFLENLGGATFKEVWRATKRIQAAAQQQMGVTLIPEAETLSLQPSLSPCNLSLFCAK